MGIVFVYPEDENGQAKKEELQYPGVKGASIGEMELGAVLFAVKRAANFDTELTGPRIIVHTDSDYVVTGFRNTFGTWQKRKWTTSTGQPLKHQQMWKELVRVRGNLSVRLEVVWVKRKSTPENRRADSLAKRSAEKPSQKTNIVRTPRRPLYSTKYDPGCISVEGQILSVHIYYSEFIANGVIEYKYEVVSRSSKFYKMADRAFSTLLLKEGHCYQVRLNTNQKYPQFLKEFGEVKKPRRQKNEKLTYITKVRTPSMIADSPSRNGNTRSNKIRIQHFAVMRNMKRK